MRVLIAEDQVLLREGLARLFQDRGHHVVAAVADAERLLPAVEQHRPDLVVVDVRMPPTFTDEGTRAARDIKEAHANRSPRAVPAHRHHARDGPHEPRRVRLPTQGPRARCPGLPRRCPARRRWRFSARPAGRRCPDGATPSDDPLSALSDRERDVLELMAQGLNNQAIARRLVVSERTVEGHVRHLLIKLDLAESDDGHRRVLAVLTHLRAPHVRRS